jgi:hypothetical protein
MPPISRSIATPPNLAGGSVASAPNAVTSVQVARTDERKTVSAMYALD